MDTIFNAQDILQIAENVEQREIDFYSRASRQLEDQDLNALCWKLAGWSLQHKKLWEQKRRHLGAQGPEAEEDGIFSHPGAMAGLTWFGLRTGSFKRAESWTCREYLLWEARQRVNDLITFYQGLKGFTEDPDALEMVDGIIDEESEHFAYVERLLRTTSDPKGRTCHDAAY